MSWRRDLCRVVIVAGGVAMASFVEAADGGAGAAVVPAVPPTVTGLNPVPVDPAVPAAGGAAGKRAAPPKPLSLLAPLAPPPVAPAESYELRRADDGSGDLLYRAPGFDARIHPDGRVRFIDRHIGLMFLPFLPYRTNTRGPTLESVLRGALLGNKAQQGAAGPRGPAGRAVDPANQPASLAPRITPYRPDPNEGCRYPAPCFVDAPVFMVAAGTFDITDELMRVFGQDPYRYEKARFMKGTEAMRVRFAARAHADDLRSASAQLLPSLQEIAADQQRTEAERRAIIEALASEVDVTTADGRRVRAIIDDFVRTRFGGLMVRDPR